MTKGIRDYAIARFMKLLPKAEEMGATGFRRRVMDDIQRQFNVSVASAATAYNFVLQKQRAEDPASVEGIGRGQPAHPVQHQGRGLRTPVRPSAETEVRDAVTLVKVRGGEVVAENISRAFARQLMETARPKLMIQQDETEEA